MSDVPATLSYGPPAPRRRRRIIGWALILLFTATAAGGWRYRAPIHAYAADRYAAWQFARAFDRAAAELTGDAGVWVAPAADMAGAAPSVDAAHRQLVRLLALSPDPQAAANAPSPPVLFAMSGRSGEARWLVFASLTGAGFETVTFERGGKGVPAYDRPLNTPGLWNKPSSAVSVRSIEAQGPNVRATLEIEGGSNEVLWALDIAAAGRAPGARGAFGVPSVVTPRTGWTSSGSWWPATKGWRLVEGRPPPRTLSTDGGGFALAFLPDGRLASAGPFRISLIDPDTDERKRHGLPDDLSAADVFSFSPDGTKLFIGGWSQPAALVDVPGGYSRRYSYSTSGRAKAAFPDDDTLVYLDNVRRARVDWKTLKSEPLKVEPSGPFLGFGAAGPLVAVPEDSQVVVGEPGSMADAPRFESVQGLHQVSLAPDGRLLALKGQAGLRLYDVEGGAELWGHDGDTDLNTALARVKWSADGRRGAAAGRQWVYVWSTADPRWVARLRHGLTGDVVDAALSPDGRRLAVGAFGAKAIAYWPDLDAAVGIAREEPPAP